MSKSENPLNNIKIASPCSADWEAMYGDNRSRFCGECKLNVYNLSGMSASDAENLIRNAEGRLCVRYYQRADGTVITEDCPVGWARIKQRARLVATAAFSMLMALFTGVLFASFFSKQKATIGDLRIPFATPTPMPLMGAVAVRPNENSNTANVSTERPVMGKMVVRPQAARDQFLTK